MFLSVALTSVGWWFIGGLQNSATPNKTNVVEEDGVVFDGPQFLWE